MFTARDLATSRDFYVEVMGLIVSDETADTNLAAQAWRSAPTTASRSSARTAPRNASASASGCSPTLTSTRPGALRPHRCRGKVRGSAAPGPQLALLRPAGTPVELCATMPTVPRMHTKTHTHRGAGALRLDHYQVLVPDVLTTDRYCMDLRLPADYFRLPVRRRQRTRIVGTYLHRKDNPWDIVLLTRSGQRYHDGGYVVEEVNDIIRACDVAGNLGFADRIEHGAGHHVRRRSSYTLRARPGRTPHRAVAARHPDHRYRRRAGALRGQPEGQLEFVGAAGAAHLGRGGDQFRRRRGAAPACRGRADDSGEIPGGAAARGGGIVPRMSEATSGTHFCDLAAIIPRGQFATRRPVLRISLRSSGLRHQRMRHVGGPHPGVELLAGQIPELERGLAQAQVLVIRQQRDLRGLLVADMQLSAVTSISELSRCCWMRSTLGSMPRRSAR